MDGEQQVIADGVENVALDPRRAYTTLRDDGQERSVRVD
jgi:hypothetical protein